MNANEERIYQMGYRDALRGIYPDNDLKSNPHYMNGFSDAEKDMMQEETENFVAQNRAENR